MNRLQAFGLRLLGFDTKVIANLVETWKNDKPIYPETNYVGMAKGLWRLNELMYACTTTKADTASQIRMDVHDKKSGKVLPGHPLQDVIENPNPFLSQKDFWASVILYCDLGGKAVFEKEFDRMGNLKYLWPIRPDRVSTIPSSNNYISGYEVTMPGYKPITLPASDILEFRMFDPLNQYNGWPPFAVASRVGSVDAAVTDFLKLFFEKGGTPPGLLKTVQRLRDAEIEEIRTRWRSRYGGYRNWLEPAVLDKDAEYQRIGLTFEEMGFAILDARNESRICSILKVPPILVNAKIGLDRSTYTNYKEARSAWWEDTLVPMYTTYEDTYTQQIARKDYDTTIECRMNFTNVPALREERLVLWQRANEGLRMGGITVNEYRNELGFNGIGENGQIFLRPLNLVAVGLDGEPQVETIEDEGDSQNDLTDTEKAMKARGSAEDEAARQKLRKELAASISKYFNRQENEVIKELKK